MNQIHSFDAAVIGGGLTGLRAAVEVAEAGLSVAVISKVHPLRSHSVAAQGGMNASLGNNQEAGEDSWEAHAFDTVKGSDYLADQDAVAVLCQAAPAAVLEMEHWGTVFSRDDEGRIAQRPFGGAGFPRTCFAADRTGHNLLHTLYQQARRRGIVFFEEHCATKLQVERGACIGFTAYNLLSGEMEGFRTNACLLATGGYGRVYAHSTNAHINTGDGNHLALQAGVPLKDMEFVQFHPTTLFGTNILISEAARGEGGLLLNRHHERFMERYSPTVKELAPRDIVARAIQKEIDIGNGFEGGFVHLDLTALGKDRIMEVLPGIHQISVDFAGVDPVEAPIPVQPGQHYSMGGVDAANDCATSLPGLYAAGECACISVHGANRLGGNSLLETIVFGRIAGTSMSKHVRGRPSTPSAALMGALKSESLRITALRSSGEGNERMRAIRNELKSTMWRSFGIFRERGSMEKGLDAIRSLQRRARMVKVGDKDEVFNQAVIGVLELQAMLPVSEAIAVGALAREESRGSHARVDFPKRDDQRFLAHSLVTSSDGGMSLSYVPVRTGQFPVKERAY